ncbi:MAG: DNA alkylation repair protein [Salinivirgaceae bacterium]|nr:DNA alkylation repair protein [Salinivirgaceae bacterium]
MTASEIKTEVLKAAEADKLEQYKKFFQCFPGGYGDGDSFAGIRNPVLRSASRNYQHISLDTLFELFTDPIHEIRLLSMFIMELKYKNKKTPDTERELMVRFYLDHLDYVNNWDLVDSSAPHVLGAWAYHHQSETLFQLAESPNLWKNRVAMLACYYYIRMNSFNVPIKIAEKLLSHKHDLIHKAVGWMLREIGNRNFEAELGFLKKTLPRHSPNSVAVCH